MSHLGVQMQLRRGQAEIRSRIAADSGDLELITRNGTHLRQTSARPGEILLVWHVPANISSGGTVRPTLLTASILGVSMKVRNTSILFSKRF